MSLNEFKEQVAKSTFGMTVKEAREKGICINCKKPALVRCYSEAGAKEYKISGMCEMCFDEIMKETMFND